MIKFAHDHYFKYCMSLIEIAKDFIQEHVPQEYLQIMRLDTLTICGNEYISKKLQKRQADVVYMVELTEYPYYAYILIEQQSKIERFEVERYFEYCGHIFHQHLQQRPNSDYCLVYTVYFNNYARDEATGRDTSYKRHFPLLNMVNVVNMPDYQLQGDLSIFKMIFKHVKLSNYAILLKQIHLASIAVNNKLLPEEFIYASTKYILEYVESKDYDEFVIQLDKLMQPVGGYMKTMADYLRAEGIEKGIERGIEKGREEGREAERLNIARNMLNLGIGIEDILSMTGMMKEELEASLLS